MFLKFLLIVLGFILLIFGADILVKGASNIAKKFNISEVLIGLTIVSLGTSLPELIITLASSTSNQDLIIGNVIGSNICNLLLILGILSLLKPIKLDENTVKTSFPILILINVLILIMSFLPFKKLPLVIDTKEGIILLIIALIYFATPIIKHFSNKNDNVNSTDVKEDDYSVIKSSLLIILGGFSLKYGGDFVVNSSINIATILNVPTNVIGLTIVALGTSLPELVTSIVAIIKRNNNIAEGNIIGSCIINFCLILGFGSILSIIELDSKSIENLIFLLFATLIIGLYGLSNSKHTLYKYHGISLLIIFTIYLLRLLVI